MNIKDLVAKISEFLIGFSKKEKHKSIIRIRTEKLLKWITTVTVFFSIVGLMLDGKEFVTVQVPKYSSYIGKMVLLRATFRKRTVERILENEFGYKAPCILNTILVDLDNNGEKTDLVIELLNNGYGENKNSCSSQENYPDQYVILKEIKWDSFWPNYTLVKLIALETYGNLIDGSSLPFNFDSIGNFLIGNVYGTDFPGYSIFGYNNGELHFFGNYYASGGLSEDNFTEINFLENNRLIMNLQDGIYRFEFDSDGKPVSKLLTPTEIIEINQSSIVLTYSNNSTNSDCGFFKANGEQIQMERRSESLNGTECIAKIQISPLQNVVPLIGCQSDEMKRINQFPWGYRINENSKTNYLFCGPHSEDGPFPYAIEILYR